MPRMQRSAGVLLAATTIGAAAAGQVTTAVALPEAAHSATIQAVLTYGAGGTTVQAWVQTSLDSGLTWIDIACFAFTTAAAKKVSSVTVDIALAAAVTPTDGTLADNTILNGLLGDRFRVKYTSTGTYTGVTTLAVNMQNT